MADFDEDIFDDDDDDDGAVTRSRRRDPIQWKTF